MSAAHASLIPAHEIGSILANGMADNSDKSRLRGRRHRPILRSLRFRRSTRKDWRKTRTKSKSPSVSQIQRGNGEAKCRISGLSASSSPFRGKRNLWTKKLLTISFG